MFSTNAIRVALPYSGFMSTNIQAIHLQKNQPHTSLCKNFVFFHDRRFWFPDYLLNYRRLFVLSNLSCHLSFVLLELVIKFPCSGLGELLSFMRSLVKYSDSGS